MLVRLPDFWSRQLWLSRTPGLVWWHRRHDSEDVLWKHEAGCFAGPEQQQRVLDVILINLSAANPKHPDHSSQHTTEPPVDAGGLWMFPFKTTAKTVPP